MDTKMKNRNLTDEEIKAIIPRVSHLEIKVAEREECWTHKGYRDDAFTLLCKDGNGSEPLLEVNGIENIKNFVATYLHYTDKPLTLTTPQGIKPHKSSNISTQVRPIRAELYSLNYYEQN